MTLNVLVPLEVLSNTHPALLAARSLFPAASLHLFHAMIATVITRPASMGLRGLAGMELQRAEKARLAQARMNMAYLGGGELVATVSPAQEILRRAEQFDLICMGTAQRGALDRFLLGSVAEEVVNKSPVPVVTISTATEVPPVVYEQPRALLLHDFSPAAEAALKFAQHHLTDMRVDVVHVVDPSALTTPLPTPVMPGGRIISPTLLESRNQEWQAQAQERLDALGGGRLLEGSPPEVALQKAAQGHDLLILGKSTKGLFERLMFGATAQRLIRESHLPVLTVNPDWNLCTAMPPEASGANLETGTATA